MDELTVARAQVGGAAEPEVAQMWFEYEPVAAEYRDRSLVAELAEAFPGPLVLVAFAAAGDEAAATAWLFTYAGGEGDEG